MATTALLDGIRILDFSQFLPGPYATYLMAKLGASVIKLEPPGGDPMRKILCPEEQERSPLYTAVNAGKAIACVDLKTVTGLETARNLVSQADVILEGFRPGTMDRLGLSNDDLLKLNPKLVICNLSGFGQTGPYKYKAGHDINYCALAGIYSFHDEKTIPDIPFPLLADHVGGLQAVNAILAALVGRERSGQGTVLDISLYETLYSWEYIDQLPGMRSMLSGGAAYYNIYRTRDNRLVTLGAIEKKFWERFCCTLKRTDWIDQYDVAFPQTNLINEIRAVIASHNGIELENMFENTDCCLQLVPLPSELHAHPQSKVRKVSVNTSPGYPGMINDSTIPAMEPCKEINIDTTFDWSTL